MNLYLVGSLEPLFKEGFLLSVHQRQFGKEDILNNLHNLKTFYFFSTREEALNYARSMRIQQPVKPILTEGSRKVAPVIEMEFKGDLSLFDESKRKEGEVSYGKYKDIYINDACDWFYAKKIRFFEKEKEEVNLSDFIPKLAYFPDINYPAIELNRPENKCAIM